MKQLFVLLKVHWRWWLIPMVVTAGFLLIVWMSQEPQTRLPMRYDIPESAR